MQDWRPHGFADKASWKLAVCDAGNQWHELAVRRRWPKQLDRWWSIVKKALRIPISALGQHAACVDALLSILAAADEASRGVGIAITDVDSTAFHNRAFTLLQ